MQFPSASCPRKTLNPNVNFPVIEGSAAAKYSGWCSGGGSEGNFVARAEVVGVQRGGGRGRANEADGGRVGPRGGRGGARPPQALHLPCGHLLGYAHNGDGAVRSSSACLFQLRLQPAVSGWGMATARRGAWGTAVPSFGSKHPSSHTTRAIRSAACPSQRSIRGRAGDRRARARSAAARIAPRCGKTSRFVPWVQVMGRSVFGRTVRHGTPRNDVSS